MRNKIKSNQLISQMMLMLSIIGPGLITANIDNDAGGIAIYSLAGAKTGYRLLWIILPITIALIIVQEMSARMGVVSGKGLADLIREKFGARTTFYTIVFLVIADLGNTTAEFAGIASAGEIFGLSKYITVPLSSLFVWFLILKGDYRIVERVFLVGCSVYISYIISGIIISPDWGHVVKSIITPNFSSIKKTDMPIIVGLIGTSITPWMQFYIQSAIVEKNISVKNLWHTKVDVIFGCLTMSLVTIFIIICCAATIHAVNGEISSAKDAAIALKPLAGKYASLLFGLGLFNASIFAAALLPLATSYYVCEGMGWESGVDKSIKEAPNFFFLFGSLIIISASIILVPGIDLFYIMIITQVVNGIFIPLILLFIINLCNDPDVMGEYTNSTWYNFICYFITALMIVANLSLLYFDLFKA